MNIVLFLGAGFSAAFGLPVMNRFFEVARTHPRLSPEDRQFLQGIQAQARNAAGTIASRIEDLEHVLSFALMAQNIERVSTDGSEPQADRLRRILGFVYGDIVEAVRVHDGERFVRFLGYDEPHNRHTTTLITTNYDLLPEAMLRPLGIPVSLANNWKPFSHRQSSYDSLYSPSGPQSISLCKLHGSVNWYDDPEDPARFLVADKRHQRNYFDPHDDDDRVKGIVLPEICDKSFVAPTCPILVPPTLFKMQNDIRFDRVWQRAGTSIQNADRLMFIGYSFPPSDTHMKYFIGAHLANNQNPPQIQVLDPNASGICNRLREDPLFGAHFKDRLQPIDQRWEQYSGSIV